MFKLLPLLGLLLFAAPVNAHPGHQHTVTPNVWLSWQTGNHFHPRQPKIRINENCVWKPWRNKTVCRY